MARIGGVMFDVDGTLILSNRTLGNYQVLPGAVATLDRLTAMGVPYVLLTNGSAMPGAEQAPKLRALGLNVADAQMLTPNDVAVARFQALGHRRVMVLGTDGVRRALEMGGIEAVAASESGAVDAVYVAWHPECSMAEIHAAAEAVLAGAWFATASDVPFFATQSGRAFGYSSAICGAIARVTGVEPAVTGKPSAHALALVCERLGVDPAALAVVGDDPRVEAEMAVAGGALGIGVTTGTTSAAEWAAQPPYRAVAHVLDRIDALFMLEPFG